ncbi:MAG TPA: GAP family protein [Solirubrobacter sp.]
MGALPQALPLALGASFYPPALLVLILLMTGPRPLPLVLAYFAGAALVTFGSGVIALAALDGAGVTTEDSKSASGGLYIVAGLVLIAFAAWAWRRRARPPKPATEEEGRVAQWSRRATSSQPWALVLGGAMYLPSPLYLLAVKEIADDGGSTAGAVVAVAICAATVLLFVEVPLVAMLLRPDGASAALQRFHGWLTGNGWALAAGVALVAGVYALVKGIAALG